MIINLLFLSLIPFLILVAISSLTGLIYFYYIDTFNRKSISDLAYIFVMGLLAPLISVPIIIFIRYLLFFLFGFSKENFLLIVIISPIIEEIAKTIVLLLVLNKVSIRGLYDGFLYGALIGSAFALVENLAIVIFVLLSKDLEGILIVIIIRSSITFIGHPFYTGLIGSGIGKFQVGYNYKKLEALPRSIYYHIAWNFVFYLPGLFEFNFGIFIIAAIVIISVFIAKLRRELSFAQMIDKKLYRSGYFFKNKN